MSETEVSPLVLFSDHNGVWCPLSNLYWSQSSKVLVSRHLKSSLEEIISSFCPQCMTRYSDDEIMKFMGRCPTCYQCPCCFSTLTSSTQDSQYVLTCGMCSWHSNEGGKLVAADKAEFDGKVLRHESEGLTKNAFTILMNKYHKTDKSASHSRVGSLESSLTETHTTNIRHGVWQLKDLEAKLEETQRKLNAPVPNIYEELLPEKRRAVEQQEKRIREVGADVVLTTQAQRDQQINCSGVPVFLREDLWPIRVRLRGKRSLRCKLDLERGKGNILIQAKVFPLEGDSSLKVSRGKWWIKDASAIHEIPFVSILKLPTLLPVDRSEGDSEESQQVQAQYSYLEISITNPLEADVVMSFLDHTVAAVVVSAAESVESSDHSSVVDKKETTASEPYYLLNQFNNPIDTSEYVQLETAPLPLPLSGTESSEETGAVPSVSRGCLDIVIGAYEDELLKDADDTSVAPTSTSTSASNGGGGVGQANSDAADGSQQWPWVVRVDQNIAFVKIPVRIATAASSGASTCGTGDNTTEGRRPFELRLCTKLKVVGKSDPAVELPMRIVF